MKNLTSTLFGMLTLTGLLAGAAPAQETTFRDLVRKKLTKDPTVTVAGLKGTDTVQALEYTVLLRTTTNGKVEEKAVDPKSYQFKVGDEIRVLIKPMNQMNIYIFHEGASAKKVCLLPTEEEKPPVTKAGIDLVLPEDGYFEFANPPGDEKLVVVATEKPDLDLASMANALFKKEGDKLTPTEAAEIKKLNARVDKVLSSQNKKLEAKTTYRSLLNEKAVAESSKAMETGDKTMAVLEEAPNAQEKSTFVMAVGASGGGRPHLYVNIPLRSVDQK